MTLIARDGNELFPAKSKLFGILLDRPFCPPLSEPNGAGESHSGGGRIMIGNRKLEMSASAYDAIIVGGSFAGLAVA